MQMPKEQYPEDDGGGFTPLPEGWYQLQLDRVETRTSSKGNDYVSVSFQVIYGDYQNRLVFVNLNLGHPEDKVRHIALRQLDAMLLAMDKDRDKLETFEELSGECAIGQVKHRKSGDKTYMEIKKWKPVLRDKTEMPAEKAHDPDEPADTDLVDDLPW